MKIHLDHNGNPRCQQQAGYYIKPNLTKIEADVTCGRCKAFMAKHCMASFKRGRREKEKGQLLPRNRSQGIA